MRIAILLLLAASLTTAAWAQPLLKPFPFSLPSQDAIKGQLLGILTEPAKPANDRISVKDGHFVWQDGSRARFFGTLFYYTGVYPDSADAITIARQLRAYGFNAVRFNAFDYSTWQSASLFERNAERFAFNEEQIKRFDWFVYQLKQNGIYIHLPLHSRRTVGANDGISNSDSLPSLLRGVSYFDPEIQDAHRQVIRKILTHRNPYTKTQYKNEPALAWLDLSDVNSFFWMWRYQGLTPGSYNLSYYHSRLIHQRWADWLSRKYKTQEALVQAWNRPADTQDNLVSNPGFEDNFSQAWTLSVNSAAQAILDPYETDRSEGEFAMRIRIGRPGPNIGHVQLRNNSIVLEKSRQYELRFFAKTSNEEGRRVAVYLSNPSSPYNNYGINNVRFDLNTQWQEFSYRFRALDDNEFGALLRFYCGQFQGDVLVDDVSFRMVDETALQPGENLRDATIAIVPYGQLPAFPAQRVSDNMAFFNDLVYNYFMDSYRLIKDTLNCDALISGQNVSYVLNDLYAVRDMDFCAISTSWDNVANWNTDNWTVNHSPMLGTTWGGNIQYVSRHALANKPLVITRFYQPYPSRYLNEMVTVWPAYAAYQEWDALYIGMYSEDRTGNGADSIRFKEFWETKNNPALMAMVPAVSQAFRRGLIAAAEGEMTLDQTQEALLYPPSQLGTFFLESNADARIALFRKIRLGRFDAEFQSAYPQRDIFELSGSEGVNTANLQSDTKELIWNADDTVFTVNAAQYVLATGHLRGKLFEFDHLFASRVDDGNVGSMCWLSLDEKPLAQSDVSLLTLSTRALNSGAVWQADNRSLGVNWGAAPTVVEAMKVELTLESERDSLFIYPLNANGEMSASDFAVPKSGSRFRILIDQSEHNSLWFRIEQRDAEQVSTSLPDEDVQSPITLLSAVWPNPARTYCNIEVNLPASGDQAVLTLHSILGDVERNVWTGRAEGQSTILRLTVDDLASGRYYLRLNTGRRQDSRTLTIVQ